MGRTAAAEDALGLHRFPGGRCIEAQDLTRLLQPVQQLGLVAKVDEQPLIGL